MIDSLRQHLSNTCDRPGALLKYLTWTITGKREPWVFLCLWQNCFHFTFLIEVKVANLNWIEVRVGTIRHCNLHGRASHSAADRYSVTMPVNSAQAPFRPRWWRISISRTVLFCAIQKARLPHWRSHSEIAHSTEETVTGTSHFCLKEKYLGDSSDASLKPWVTIRRALRQPRGPAGRLKGR